MVFVPFVWGLGVLSAAATITFRRGASIVAAAASVMTITSGAYFPVDVLPPWIAWIATLNPMRLTLEAVRDALLGGASWSAVVPTIAVLIPLSILSLTVGILAFRAALTREQRKGTLGLY
jgi:ABC-2 type transport system permease protein